VITLGFRMAVKGKNRLATVVIIDDASPNDPTYVSHTCDSGQPEAGQARELRDWVRTFLAGHQGVAAAILFEADYNARARVTAGTKLRLRLEGATLTALLDHIGIVEVKDGRGLGGLIGGSKDAALALGASSGAPTEYSEAAAAALAASELT
jgi:hypothetical protein